MNVQCGRVRCPWLQSLLVVAVLAARSPAAAQGQFQRADANGDAAVDISDALFILGFLFIGTEEPACFDAADANDDGTVDISDATYTLGFLFLGSADPPSPGPNAPGPDPTADVLTCGSGPVVSTHGYATSRLSIALTQAQAREMGFDLDGDAEGRLDNNLGLVLAVAAQAGLDVQGRLADALQGGSLVLLHQLEAASLGEGLARWRVLVGEDVTPPLDLSGDGQFAVSPGAPGDAHLDGTIAGGRFSGGPGSVQIEIAATSAVTIALDLIGVRLQVDVTEDGCSNGRIGGGITQDEIDSALIPGLAATFQAIVEAEPDAESTQTLLSFYDDNDDGRIDVEDLRASALLTSLLAPDVDLLDAGGAFHPRADGVNDSLSFAIGFECVKAQLTFPDGR